MPHVIARHQHAPAWRANGATGIHLIEVEPFPTHLVDVRRLDLILAVEAKVPRPQVIGHDEHDIRLVGGFRAIRRDILERIGFERSRADGYAFQIEMNYRFVHYGARIKEIPFLFLDRTRGESKLSLQIGFEALWIPWWLRIADRLGWL